MGRIFDYASALILDIDALDRTSRPKLSLLLSSLLSLPQLNFLLFLYLLFGVAGFILMELCLEYLAELIYLQASLGSSHFDEMRFK